MSKNYDLKSAAGGWLAAPEFPYAPPTPKSPPPKIGLIGCGGITEHHLKAYQAAGWEVAAFFDPNPEAAEKRRAEFDPDARVCAETSCCAQSRKTANPTTPQPTTSTPSS